MTDDRYARVRALSAAELHETRMALRTYARAIELALQRDAVPTDMRDRVRAQLAANKSATRAIVDALNEIERKP